MPVYYGPNLPNSVFSIGIFTRDFGFEVWFKDHMCVVWIPRKMEGKISPILKSYPYQTITCMRSQSPGLIDSKPQWRPI